METMLKLAVSFAAGLLSFLTPCVLPLVPSYVTFIGGTTLQEIRASGYDRTRLFIRTLFFVLGFTVVFVLAGIFLWGAFSLVGELSGTLSAAINIVAGSIVILLGLNIVFDFLPFLMREAKAAEQKRPENNLGSLAAGMAFGAGWSPCIGPLLGSIITLTATGQSVFGILNLVVYSLGLGVPFMLLSLAFVPISTRLARAKKYLPVLKTTSGFFLMLMGILIILGQLFAVTAFMTAVSFGIRETHAALPWLFPLITAVLFLTMGVIPVISAVRKRQSTGVGSIIPGFWGRIWFSIFSSLAILQVFGLFPLYLWIADWLLVQEVIPLHF